MDRPQVCYGGTLGSHRHSDSNQKRDSRYRGALPGPYGNLLQEMAASLIYVGIATISLYLTSSGARPLSFVCSRDEVWKCHRRPAYA